MSPLLLLLLLLLPLVSAAAAASPADPDRLNTTMARVRAVLGRAEPEPFLAGIGAVVGDFLFLSRMRLLAASGHLDPAGLGPALDAVRSLEAAVANHSARFLAVADALDHHGDGNSLQLGACLRVLTDMEARREAVLAAGEGPGREAAVARFEEGFDQAQVLLADSLRTALFRPGGGGLVARVRALTHDHPGQVGALLRGATAMLVQAAVVDLAHTDLLFNASEAAAGAVVHQRAEEVAEVALRGREVVWQISAGMMAQAEADQARLLGEMDGQAHCEVTMRLGRYLSEKYPSLEVGVVAYDALSSFKRHAFRGCRTNKAFRMAGRNSLVTLVPRGRRRLPGFVDWAKRRMEAVGIKRADSNYAMVMLQEVANQVGHDCNSPAQLVAVIDARANMCFFASPGMEYVQIVRETYRCNTSLCWIKKHYHFNVLMFG